MIKRYAIVPASRLTVAVSGKPRSYGPRGLLLRANFKAAMKALTANGSRSFLTMLGVVIGVAAVITAVTQADGTSANINQSFSSLGTDILTVEPGSPPSAGGGYVIRLVKNGDTTTLKLSDSQALNTLPHVVQVSPILQTQMKAIYQNQNGNFSLYGVSPEYQTIHSLQLAEGSWFSQLDNDSRTPKIVIGAVVAQNLFASLHTDPLGKTVRLGNELFQVIGVLTSANFLNDQSIYAPFNTVQVRVMNAASVDQIEVQVDDTNNLALVQQEITGLLEQRHRVSGDKDDFWVQSASQLIQSKQASASSLASLLIGIAAVSLTVGGIGIMNIMLVSVTERTREIGVRMAVGARKSDIRNQFLIEAIVLSATGGAIGVLFGLFIGYEIVNGSQLPFILDTGAILLAVGVAGCTGIIFGFYPAVRASDLDPIVALRSM